MSDFVELGPCSSCGSRDNLGIYTDHVYCFGCGYYASEKHMPKVQLKRKANDTNGIFLPSDFTRSVPEAGLKWLESYGLTWDDVLQHRLGWSDAGILLADGIVFSPCLIFPVYDCYGNLLMWQGRYFGKEQSIKRKYYTRGGRDILHIMGNGGILTLVEDMVSAIKIAKVGRALPLFGSSINLDLLVRLHRVTPEFAIWLDKDKFKDAKKFQVRAKQFFRRVDVVDMPLDPKCYSLAELRTILGCT